MQDDEKKSADEHTEHSIEEDDNEDDNLIQSKTYNIVVGGGRFTHRRLHNAPTDSLNYYSLDEMLRERVKQLLQSNFYFLLYLCMIAICILLLVWMLFHRGVPRQTLFIFFEAIVTVSLAFEVLLRIYIERKQYFTSYMNWFDLFISVLSVVGFAWYLYRIKDASDVKYEEFIDTMLVALRYCTAVLRIIIFIRKQQTQRELMAQQFIDLTPQPDALVLTPNADELELSDPDQDLDNSEGR